MRKVRRQYAGTDERRRRIVEAALSCFVETGFVNVTMEDIRIKSGASNGSIYHHFKSKEQLAAAVYLEGIGDYQTGLLSELDKNPTAKEGVFAIVRYHLHWIKEHPSWARYLFQERRSDFMRSSEGAIFEKNKSFVEGTSGWFRRHVKEKRFRVLPPELYISLILGPCQEYARHWLKRGSGADLDFIIEEIAEAAWQAIRNKKTR